jgi:hypothetical protein
VSSDAGGEGDRQPSVACRTLDRPTEIVYLVLGLLPFAASCGLVVAALWPRSTMGIALALPIAALFATMGAVLFKRLVLVPATGLAFDPVQNDLSWTNIFRRGHVSASDVTRVERFRQPGMYQVVLDEGRPVRFWFSRAERRGLKAVMTALTERNPTIDIHELMERKFYWPGLERRPRRTRGGRSDHGAP